MDFRFKLLKGDLTTGSLEDTPLLFLKSKSRIAVYDKLGQLELVRCSYVDIA